ncbi:MAG: hypothetical protein WB999_11185, partial [Candidatus Binataceae bacterium]
AAPVIFDATFALTKSVKVRSTAACPTIVQASTPCLRRREADSLRPDKIGPDKTNTALIS